ncbi:class I SAM-dependent methyltransferase [Candidatus Chlorohelix sp.]|uniref:class I SAM-dependent methyltransferase n=1 Tax=Candidatus Chlorohelix sp. TaxID=3139201 RepID=UPI00305121DE
MSNFNINRYIELNREDWNRETERYQEQHKDNLVGANGLWGPIFGVPRESELQILGDVVGKEALELGCGGGQWSARLAKQGARVIGQDISDNQVEFARHAFNRLEIPENAKLEFVQGNAEDLSEWQNESFDIVFSNFGAVGFVDIERSFKEVGRVLKKGGLFAFSWVNPLFDCFADEGENQLEIVRSYFDRSPMTAESGWKDGVHTLYVQFHHTYGDWQRAINAADLLLTDIIELEPQRERWRESTWSNVPWYKVSMIPSTTIWRARKPKVPLSVIF